MYEGFGSKLHSGRMGWLRGEFARKGTWVEANGRRRETGIGWARESRAHGSRFMDAG